jgi:predicted metalloprotease
VQARPPDSAYLWTDGAVFLSTDGIGDAPGQLYEALPTMTPAPGSVGAGGGEEPAGEELLDTLPAAERATGSRAPRILGSAGKTIEQWLGILTDDVGVYWQGMFKVDGNSYVPATLSLVSAPLATPRCGNHKPTDGPSYCNHTLFFGLTWLVQNVQPIGDTAFAMIVAHETAHNVQEQIGVLDDRSVTDMQVELQADCLAGTWAATVFQRSLLEEGDIQEAARVTAEWGDRPGQRVNPHGTPTQRVEAFFRGYNQGRAGICKAADFPASNP